MNVIVIGATGTIGQAVVSALESRHEVIRVSRSSGDFTADISSPESIRSLYEDVPSFDALVCAAGNAAFGALDELSDEDFELGLSSKLMGQVNLVREGRAFINEEGSFTLTSGVLSQEPAEGSAAISMVNAGVEAFARAAALELPRQARVNVVSPPWIRETLESMGRDPAQGLPAATVAQAYVDSVEGNQSGAVIDARDYT